MGRARRTETRCRNDRDSDGMNPLTLAVGALIVVGLVAPGIAIAGPPAPTPCTGRLTGTVNGDVVVPAGESCTIQDAAISGSVTVRQNASLLVTTDVGFTTIRGHVRGKNCAQID